MSVREHMERAIDEVKSYILETIPNEPPERAEAHARIIVARVWQPVADALQEGTRQEVDIRVWEDGLPMGTEVQG